MLSRPDAQRLAALLGQIGAVLSAESRVAVGARIRSAVADLSDYVAGRDLDRNTVAAAVVYLELEMRRLRRGREEDSAERERLWVEIDAIADEL